jgi:DNA polymerase III, delta subunit
MKYQSVKLFQKHLEASAPHALSRVYLVAMPDDFERKRWLDLLISLVASPDQPLLHLSALDATLSELFTEIDSPSLFASEPVTLIDELEKLSKKQAQGFLDLLARPDLNGYLILGSRGKSPLSSAVEKRGVIFDLCDEKPWEKEKRLTEQLFDRAKQAGKRLSFEALQLLLERVDKDAALLEGEIDKLICFTGLRPVIEPADVQQIAASSRTHTSWQTAEEIVWEGRFTEKIDETSFHGLLPAIRSQLQTGLKIASLIETQASMPEISARLPKVWPKMLEKRASQAARLGSGYFQKGLELLFRIELLSRSGSSDLSVLLDWLRASLIKMGKI